MNKKDICPCGLTCCDCLFHKEEIYETANKLKEVIENTQFDKFLNLIVTNEAWDGMANHFGVASHEIKKQFESFEKFSDFLLVLDGIINLQCKTTCQETVGCSGGGITRQCEALKCIQKKNYKGCWECDQFSNCEKLAFLKQSYGETIDDNLRTIKNKGFGEVKSRGNKYYSWQRQ